MGQRLVGSRANSEADLGAVELTHGLLSSHHVHLAGQTGAELHTGLVEADGPGAGVDPPPVPGAPVSRPEVPTAVELSAVSRAAPLARPRHLLSRHGAHHQLGLTPRLQLLLHHGLAGLVLPGVEERPEVGLRHVVDGPVLAWQAP